MYTITMKIILEEIKWARRRNSGVLEIDDGTMIDNIETAIVKQIPQKPSEHYNWCDLSDDEREEIAKWYCRTCNESIYENELYCSQCGQKLDWN